MDYLLGPVVLIALGLALAFAGRRFIWLVVGAAGFVIAYDLVTWIFPSQVLAGILAGAVLGVILGWLAIRFTKLLLSVAGFILIGHAATVVAALFGMQVPSLMGALVFLIGGVVGFFLVRLAFDWALVLISALAGGALVMWGVPRLFGGGLTAVAGILGLAVAVAGAYIQLRGPKGGQKAATA